MSNRIIGINGEPAGEPKAPNVRDMIESARLLYDKGDTNQKRVAFHRLCDAMHLLSQGVARGFRDNEKRDADIKLLKERITPK